MPIEVWHLNVQENQVGLELSIQIEDLPRISGALDARVAPRGEDLLQELDVGLLVIHDEDSRVVFRPVR
jgi:hypothetical protein